MTEEQTSDQAARQYALAMLNRAEVAFDVRDIHTVAAVLRVIEYDMADWLAERDAPPLLVAFVKSAEWRKPTATEGDDKP